MECFMRKKTEQTLEQLRKRMLIFQTELNEFEMLECGYKTSEALPCITDEWHIYEKGERWGNESDSHCWFHKRFSTNCENSYLAISTSASKDWDDSNPQFMVYLDGKLVQGIDVNHTEILLKEKKAYDLYLYAYSGMVARLIDFNVSLKVYNEKTRKLYYDLKVPYDVAILHNPEEKVYIDIMSYLINAQNLIDFRANNGKSFETSIDAALAYIEDEFYNKFCNPDKCEATTICIGHTHIDVAWLWTLAQTKEKVLRSFSTVINLMKQYPEYKFMSSQAQLYKYVKEQSPELYNEIKEMISQGRWEVEGAMWVEADCILTSGESLVRQIMFGKKFFKDEFNIDSKVMWLPDAFGYSAALPQILIKSGITRFVTSKISWSEFNMMPNDTFMWQGIDGSEILAYFLTAQNKVLGAPPRTYNTYNAFLTPAQSIGAWERYQNKNISDEVIITYGYGDGGGGPTAEMIETGKRLQRGIPGCTVTKFDTAGAFLDRIENKFKNCKKTPRWVGELYLELHRGTYTSMAKTKRYNRKSEFLYQTTELMCAHNMTLNQAEYPQSAINDGWEIILLNQFHDILPGSSIKEVYEVSDRQYEEIQEKAATLIDASLKNISRNIKTDGGVLVYNPLSFTNSGTIEIDGKKGYVKDIPAKGYKVVKEIKYNNNIKLSKNCIENKFFKINFEGADIVSIYDKQNMREVIKSGQKANVLRAFEDYPKDFDNWEITNYYKDKMWIVDEVLGIEPFDDGVCAGIKITKQFVDSVIEQKICLYDDIARIDFDTHIDWKQDHILLKAFFPIDIHAEKATYDIQFGTIERPTHQNTSWDAAKFEVCAHKFADISEDDYGVSLMNDCKYGYDVFGNEMSITLIKSGTFPNPDADKCEHDFVYSIYPHKGNHKQGGTIHEAYRLNVPMYAMNIAKQDGILSAEHSLVTCSADNIIVDTVKKAENSDSIVFRMYEAFNRRTKFRLDFGCDFKKCYLADLCENKLEEINITDNCIELEAKPFEIITIMAE